MSFSVHADRKHFQNGGFRNQITVLTTMLLILTLEGALSQAFPPLVIAAFEERFRKAPFSA